MTRFIAVNAGGFKIGEFHHRAKISDKDVELIRDLHENDGLTYKEIEDKFENQLSVWAIGKICRYERRAQYAHKWLRSE